MLAVAFSLILPGLADIMRRSFPTIPGLPGYNGEYYLLVLALIPLWLDLLTRLMNILFGKIELEKIQVPTPTLQLLQIPNRVYHLWTHRFISGIKILFSLLPLASLTLWVFRSSPMLLLSGTIFFLYLSIIVLEDYLSFRRISFLTPVRRQRLTIALIKVLLCATTGYVIGRSLLHLAGSLNLVSEPQDINPIGQWVIINFSTLPGTILALVLLLSLSGICVVSQRKIGKFPLSICLPNGRPSSTPYEPGLLYPITGISYFSALLSQRKNILLLTASGLILALSPAFAAQASEANTRIGIFIALMSFTIGSSFEEAITWGFSRNHLRYRFYYEAGCSQPELILKIHLVTLSSFLPQLLLGLCFFTGLKFPWGTSLLCLFTPAVMLLICDGFFFHKIRAEGIRFTIIALVQTIGSLSTIGLLALSPVLAYSWFFFMISLSILTSRKAIACLT